MILGEFDPKKPFYGLVLVYLSQVHGFFELIARGLLQRFERFCQGPTQRNLSKEELMAKYSFSLGIKDVEGVLRAGKTTLLNNPVLLSQTGEGIKWDSTELAETVFMEYEAALQSFNRLSAGSLLILAWDRVPPKHRGSPIGQFLKHCRNAAAHNGAFHFKPEEPKKPAEWRTLSIVRTMQGDSLFADPPKPGFIRIGDVLYLLADIEKQFN